LIIWADSDHFMRVMDVEPADSGREVMVRSLLKAMEHPQGPLDPSRPQKIVVRDRETQLFLRGVLQDLDIKVEYARELPLIEAVWEGLQEMFKPTPPSIPSGQVEHLMRACYCLWHDAPWEQLWDHNIIAIDVNYGDIDTLYVSVMGQLGMEYGALFYRSQDSLRQFREAVVGQDSASEKMEATFLNQDCMFVNFEPVEDEELEQTDEAPFLSVVDMATTTGVSPVFGSIHPLEGMRPFLDEEEAIVMTVALEALHRFFQRHAHKFDRDEFPAVSGRYRIPIASSASEQLTIQVKTLPDLSEELEAFGNELEEEEESLLSTLLGGGIPMPLLRDDLIPEQAFFSLGMLPWPIVEKLRQSVQHHQSGFTTMSGEGLPVVMIQTSQPKVKKMIQTLKAAGGIKGLGFNPGEGEAGEPYDLGILKTEDNQLYLFGEYYEDEPVHIQAKRKWNKRCRKTKGWCGLVIARGLSGASRGNPQLEDFMALFEVKAFSERDFRLGVLTMMPRSF
jgi:hypothetical protein